MSMEHRFEELANILEADRLKRESSERISAYSVLSKEFVDLLSQAVESRITNDGLCLSHTLERCDVIGQMTIEEEHGYAKEHDYVETPLSADAESATVSYIQLLNARLMMLDSCIEDCEVERKSLTITIHVLQKIVDARRLNDLKAYERYTALLDTL